jgi:hypothetical protein
VSRTSELPRPPGLVLASLSRGDERGKSAIPYEQRLRLDPRWTMSETSKFFEGTSAVQESLHDIAHRLDGLGVPYVVIGGMALSVHGYPRTTEDIDLLVTRENLKTIHRELVGLGYKKEFAQGKHLRNTNTQVKIEFVLTGDYPGSGKKQPISFPDPSKTPSVEYDGIKFVDLAPLVELKLASGMTGGADRAKDFVDVQQLIKNDRLDRDFANQLHKYVRPKYRELWDGLNAVPKKYVTLWRNKFLTLDAKSIDDMIGILSGAADELRRMKADGVTLDPDGRTGDDYAHLITSDPAVAEKYSMHDESEFFGEGDQGDEDEKYNV